MEFITKGKVSETVANEKLNAIRNSIVNVGLFIIDSNFLAIIFMFAAE